MCAIRLLALAFLTEADFARGFDCDARCWSHMGGLGGWERGVALGVGERGAWVGEDGRGVGPVEQDVEGNADEGEECACRYLVNKEISWPLYFFQSDIPKLACSDAIRTSTHTAHVVKPYTNDSGKYVSIVQQYRSHFRQKLFVFRLPEGEVCEGDPRVAMLADVRRVYLC